MVLKYTWLQLLNGYKLMLPLEMGTHEMADDAMGRNICFLLQQVDSDATESNFKVVLTFSFVGFYSWEKDKKRFQVVFATKENSA